MSLLYIVSISQLGRVQSTMTSERMGFLRSRSVHLLGLQKLMEWALYAVEGSIFIV